MRLAALIRTAVAVTAALVLGATLLSVSPATSAPAGGETSFTDGSSRTAPASQRRACRVPKCWIAGTRNPKTGIAYMNWNLSTKGAAARAAMKQCRKKTRDRYDSACTKSGNQRHGCLAIAYLVRNKRYQGARSAGVGYARRLSVRETKQKAIRLAKKKFKRAKGVRKVWSAHCTAR